MVVKDGRMTNMLLIKEAVKLLDTFKEPPTLTIYKAYIYLKIGFRMKRINEIIEQLEIVGIITIKDDIIYKNKENMMGM